MDSDTAVRCRYNFNNYGRIVLQYILSKVINLVRARTRVRVFSTRSTAAPTTPELIQLVVALRKFASGSLLGKSHIDKKRNRNKTRRY
jgi:hypothetical protein